MRAFDLALKALLPSLILLHLLVAPYTKVEESFNLQATHDILTYGTPTSNVGVRLRSSYDHFEFPGAVPRTFVGATVLAGVSQPILHLLGAQHGQLVVRAVLGLFNAFALLRFGRGVERAFGRGTGRWYIVLQAAQFHIVFYASRTLPNMFAFGLSTLALGRLLPTPARQARKGKSDRVTKRHCLAIYLLVLAGVVFRSELAILLFSQLLYLLLQPAISLQTIIRTGLRSFVVALAISIPIDSYFWQTPIWPELSGFIYNAIHGNSTAWGTSPFHAYFTSFLPKMLLNPLIPALLLPLSLYLPSTRHAASGLIFPSLLFIAIYSLQPHKEARFIIYTVPPFTAAAALSASYIFTRRVKSTLYLLLSALLVLSVLGSFAASFVFLAISSLNYPGGEALWTLHQLVSMDPNTNPPPRVNVYMDVLSCMTGVSRFQQESPTAPFSSYLSSKIPNVKTSTSEEDKAIQWRYSKSENLTLLHTPAFWQQFDYILTETPEKVIGKWEVLCTVYGYAGIEILRPGQRPRPDHSSAEDVAEMVGLANENAGLKERKLGGYEQVRDRLRDVSRGWWVGPRMEGRIRILKKIP